MKIGITGASGFVGQFLFENLGYTLNSISLRDVKNIKKIQDQDVIIHLAGKAHDLKKISDSEDYYKINTALTIKVFDEFLKSNCKVFIFMSTVKAVADSVTGVLTEDIIPSPITAYGKSKLKAEEYILSKKRLETKKVYILRPCMIHGPNNKGNLNLLYKILNKKIPFPLGKFKNKRSFLSIDNLCFVIKTLIVKQPESGVFNIADDETLSTNELVTLIGEVINKPVRIINIPKIAINVFATIGDIIPFPINKEQLEKLTENYCVSNTKIKEVLGVELPYTAYQGLRKTILSFK